MNNNSNNSWAIHKNIYTNTRIHRKNIHAHTHQRTHTVVDEIKRKKKTQSALQWTTGKCLKCNLFYALISVKYLHKNLFIADIQHRMEKSASKVNQQSISKQSHHFKYELQLTLNSSKVFI